MDQHKTPDGLQTIEIDVTRRGFSKPVMEFSDGESFYCKIDLADYKHVWTFDTPTGTYQFKREGKPSHTWVLTDPKGEIITAFEPLAHRNNTTITLSDGFTANLSIGGVWYFKGTWSNDQYPFLLSVSKRWWSYGKPFKITIDTSLLTKVPELSLLAVLGIYLLDIYRKR
jgi:hypothetical protein